MNAPRIVDFRKRERERERERERDSTKEGKKVKSRPKRTTTENEERDSPEFCEGLQTISAGLSGFRFSK